MCTPSRPSSASTPTPSGRRVTSPTEPARSPDLPRILRRPARRLACRGRAIRRRRTRARSAARSRARPPRSHGTAPPSPSRASSPKRSSSAALEPLDRGRRPGTAGRSSRTGRRPAPRRCPLRATCRQPRTRSAWRPAREHAPRRRTSTCDDTARDLHRHRSVIERGTAAADDTPELIAHAPQRRDASVDLVDLLCHPRPQRLRRRTGAASHTHVLRDLGQREPDRLRVLDLAHEPNGLLVIAAMPARRPLRRRQQPPPLVVTQRLDVHPRPLRDLTDSHANECNPVPGYGNQPHLRRDRTTAT